MRVTYFRRKVEGSLSIESLFDSIRRAMPEDVTPTVVSTPYQSGPALGCLLNLLDAPRHQSDVNHIEGDVHYLIFLLHKERTILTIHDCNFLYRPMGWLKRLGYRIFWYALPLRIARNITVISEATKEELVREFSCDPAKITVIPDCYDPSFVPGAKAFEEDRPRILQVGTGWNKNLEKIAAALEGVACVLDVVGCLSPSQRESLARHGIQYESSSEVPRRELVRKYQACDIVTFVSVFEGFGMPIIEAQAVGRPVVTSDLAPMNKVAGGAACLVDPHDVQSISGGIKRVITDRQYRNRLVEAGRRNVAKYQCDRVARQYYDLYRAVVSGASHTS